MTFVLCKEEIVEEGKEVVYIEESAITAIDREAEHHSALRTLNEESPLVEHSLKAHRDKATSFKIRVLKFCRTNLMRQALQAYRIQARVGMNLLNRRGALGQNLPPSWSLRTRWMDPLPPKER